MDVKEQAAIVTGAASGLGEATARALARSGARVALLDINGESTAVVASEIGGLAIVCDVADAVSAENAIAKARAAHRPARIAVNRAGVAPRPASSPASASES